MLKLAEQLKHWTRFYASPDDAIERAIREIRILEAKNQALREALQPFAALADDIEAFAASYDRGEAASEPPNWAMSCYWDDLVRARAALERNGG